MTSYKKLQFSCFFFVVVIGDVDGRTYIMNIVPLVITIHIQNIIYMNILKQIRIHCKIQQVGTYKDKVESYESLSQIIGLLLTSSSYSVLSQKLLFLITL